MCVIVRSNNFFLFFSDFVFVFLFFSFCRGRGRGCVLRLCGGLQSALVYACQQKYINNGGVYDCLYAGGCASPVRRQ